MPRSPDPLVILAADTPLYAPALLAKAERINTACARMRFRISRTPRFHGDTRDDYDPFVHDVLSEASAREHVVLGIGDPMRITAVPDGYADRPFVVGTMIKRMCYWVVDRRRRCNDNDGLSATYSHLLVHPLGMTGFAVAYCDEKNKSGNDDKTLTTFLVDKAIPGHEERIYTKVSRKLQRSQPPAFITADPLVDDYGRRDDDNLSNVRSYLRSTDPALVGAIMTGFITGQELYQRENAIIDEILHGIRCAIELIEDSPVLAAAQLYKRAHTIELNFSHMNEPARLIRALEIIAGRDAYELRDAVDNSAWEKSIALRKQVEHLLPQHALNWQKADNIASGFHKERVMAPPAPTSAPLVQVQGAPNLSPDEWGREAASALVKDFASEIAAVKPGSTGVGFRKLWWRLFAIVGVLPLALFLCMTHDFLVKQVSVWDLPTAVSKPRFYESVWWSLPIGVASLAWPLVMMAHIATGCPKRMSLSPAYSVVAALAYVASLCSLVFVFVDVKESWLLFIAVIGSGFLLIFQYGLRQRWNEQISLARQRRARRQEVADVITDILQQISTKGA